MCMEFFLLTILLVLSIGAVFLLNLKISILYILTFMLGINTIIFTSEVFVFFRENKKRKMLNSIIEVTAKDYCKQKLNKSIDSFKIELFYARDLISKRYLNSGIVYLDKNKTDYIKIFLSSDLSVRTVNSNIINNQEILFREYLESILNKLNLTL